MKNINKLIIISTLLTLGLVGCAGQGKSDEGSKACGDCSIPAFHTQSLELKVAAPAGSPAVALFAHISESTVEINAAENVQSYMTDTADKDIVILPTNYGVNMIANKGVGFKLAATVTFGNFFLLSTGKDSDGVLSEGDKVIAFQQNGVAGKLFNYVYGDKGLDVTYLTDAASVKNKILTEDLDAGYVLLAQPVVAAILGQKSEYKVYANVQNDYKEKTGGKEITQASIFVRNDVDANKAKTFLKNIKEDVEALLKDPELLASATSEIEDQVFTTKLTGTKTLVTNLLKNNNQIGLGFKYAVDNKESIDAFIGTLGLPATNEEIYFRIN